MIFRNITAFFTLQQPLFDIDVELEKHRLRDIGALELASVGFVPAYGTACGDKLTRTVDGATLLAVGRQDKVLPSAAVNELFKKQLTEAEEREGTKLGLAARKALKDKILTEMLARAFVVTSQTHVLLLGNLVLVDASSRKQAEACISVLRGALGTFPAHPLHSITASSTLTMWLKTGEFPDQLTPADSCEFYDPGKAGVSWRAQEVDLRSDEVVQLCKNGKAVMRLGLVFDDALSFTLCDDMTIRKFRLFDGAAPDDSGAINSLEDELDARLALMAGQARKLFAFLQDAFRIDSTL